jgi:hypothetical protein
MNPNDKLVAAYLRRLERALADLPRARRRELGEEISEHIAAARAQLPAESEAEVRTILERLGEPEEIADDARERLGIALAKPGAREVWTVILLPLGGLAYGIGWLVGVVLLWTSPVWTRAEKLVGTLVLPGGLLPAFLLVQRSVRPACEEGKTDCPDGGLTLEAVALIALVVLPFVCAAYLGWRLQRKSKTFDAWRTPGATA